MAKVQTRRSISINGDLHMRAMQFAASKGVPLSLLTERAIVAFLANPQPSNPDRPLRCSGCKTITRHSKVSSDGFMSRLCCQTCGRAQLVADKATP